MENKVQLGLIDIRKKLTDGIGFGLKKYIQNIFMRKELGN